MTFYAYNKLFSIHGIIMVFFFLVPVAPAVLGNFLIPLMIGAKDVAFPKINLISWYLFVVGGCVELYTMLSGGVDTGSTFTTPLSTHFLNTNVIAAAMGIFIAGFSSILTGLNFIVTIHRLRAPGMTWFRLPLFIWSYYATSIIFVLATPVIAISMVLLVLERVFGIGVFDPRLGGDPLLFQHLFWFYSHPAVCAPSLSPCRPAWGSSQKWLHASVENASSVIPQLHFRPSLLGCSASSSGRTTCSSWESPTIPRSFSPS